MTAYFKSKANGNVIQVDSVDENLLVHYHPAGGGFDQRQNLCTFVEDFEPYEFPGVMSPILVTGDWMDPDEHYPAWTDGKRWNGWEVPHFERAQLEAMLERQNSGVIRSRGLFGYSEEVDGNADFFVPFTKSLVETPLGVKECWSMDGWCWTEYNPANEE